MHGAKNTNANVNANARSTNASASTNNYWNDDYVRYIANILSPSRNEPFKATYQSGEQVVVDAMGMICDDGRKIPSHLDLMSQQFIYQVDTMYSGWHSILALIYPEYSLLDYDNKKKAVAKFREVINNEFINNNSLREQIKKSGLRLVHVEDAIQQEKIQDETLLRFLALYFEINIYVATDDSLKLYYEGPLYLRYRSCILLYRYPYGNLAPIMQEKTDCQLLSEKYTPDIMTKLKSRFEATLTQSDLQLSETTPLPIKVDASPVSISAAPTVVAVAPVVATVVATAQSIEEQPQSSSRTKRVRNGKDDKAKFASDLMKLKWEELAELAEKESIKTQQPTTKGFNSWKRKTKTQLIEELWEATVPVICM